LLRVVLVRRVGRPSRLHKASDLFDRVYLEKGPTDQEASLKGPLGPPAIEHT